MKYIKKILVRVIALSLILSTLNIRAVDVIITDSYEEEVIVASDLFSRKYEINTYYQEMLKGRYTGEIYNISPSITSPYRAGEIKDEPLNDALLTLNYIRFLAHLDDNVSLLDSWNTIAQHATLVNGVNKELSHNPAQPSGMSSSMYDIGALGARTSNLAWSSYSSSLVKDLWRYIDDSSSSNVDSVGHRRWLLNPAMEKVGFGKTSNYSAAKVFGDSYNQIWQYDGSYDYVAWPGSGAFPTNAFSDNMPWSISLNDKLYDNDRTSEIKVLLQNMDTGSINEFYQGKSYIGSEHFNVDTTNYGVPFNIVFRPDGEHYIDGQTYKVTISGLYDNDGNETSVTYEVNFFDVDQFNTNLVEQNNFYYAEVLNELDLFKGTNNGYELDRQPTRLEGLVMFIRLIGKEAEALALNDNVSYFTDVPDWGRGYVNYAYENGLTLGIGGGEFGSDHLMQARDYMTFIMRALGYDDMNNDFAWSSSLEDGLSYDIISENMYTILKNKAFLRDDVVGISYIALESIKIDSIGPMTLGEYLGL
ncbi:MAG: hypothetical protein PF505_11665 [Vallitaleaceae bacterium]|jgi:hypothetical protein|nr:hypothetical protein [Vallitaleaceae bacterium]